jgi:hypothetical protein
LEAIAVASAQTFKNDAICNKKAKSLKMWLFDEFYDITVDFLNLVNIETNLILKKILKSMRVDSLL